MALWKSKDTDEQLRETVSLAFNNGVYCIETKTNLTYSCNYNQQQQHIPTLIGLCMASSCIIFPHIYPYQM